MDREVMGGRAARSWPGPGWLVGWALALVSGCASTHARLESALLADSNPAAHSRDLEAHYRVRCPDVIDVEVDALPACSGRAAVAVDGCVRLPGGLVLRVDGLTTPLIAQEISRQLRVPVETVRVRVADYKSQHLYLFGEMAAHQVLPYRGPETILDVLQRLGGTKPGAALGDVRIVRAHVADGKPPEVFHVDLSAILLRRDLATNIRLEPFDRIHIGRTRTSCLESCIPPWLQPLYRQVCGIR